MAYIRIETREVIWCWGWLLEPEITFRPEESTDSSFQLECLHIILKTLGSLICIFFYLYDFLKYLMLMNSGIWGSEL